MVFSHFFYYLGREVSREERVGYVQLVFYFSLCLATLLLHLRSFIRPRNTSWWGGHGTFIERSCAKACKRKAKRGKKGWKRALVGTSSTPRPEEQSTFTHTSVFYFHTA
ncbi:hypothetical protein K450DRAFT_217852 [Umbelopsis ramanniana AG]|uniref:Transmembrane protein n=1 Tax=Umbelopsis ramanniana AG TaxID=1314678 RepID=A0AAD5EJI0_UMBRA|nr:uncharacterized protein K450DRAFT_217852 [Umbelopsis ramanniana AG]KAI8584754.1 hypothetical protein K450DRAFT_217852 [Umbelopsis ramanniana AG]